MLFDGLLEKSLKRAQLTLEAYVCLLRLIVYDVRTTMKRTMLCLLLCASSLAAQTGAKNGEWKTYGGDLGNTHYSPLDQINASNFKRLQIAWRFKTDNLGAQPEFNLESTPLMVNGVLYSTVGTRRAVVAIDAGTGELIWT